MNSFIRHISDVIDGIASIISIPHTQREYRVTKNGFLQDKENLRSDVNNVGNDIQNKARQIYKR